MYNNTIKKHDGRKFNIPPVNPNTIRRFTRTVTARVEEPILAKLLLLLNKRYNFRKIPMNSLSYVIRRAILLKIRELENSTV
jgi:hypothetical protein